MRATTNWGDITLLAPEGGAKSGVPLYFSDNFAGVPQADAKEGETVAVLCTGIEITVEIDGDAEAFDPIRISPDHVVSVGAAGAGYAKLGVAKFDSRESGTKDHVVTAAEDAANTYGAAVEGDVVQIPVNVVKVIVQSI